MLKHIIAQWEVNKHKLQEYFQTTNQKEYDSYRKILCKTIELATPIANEDYGYLYDIKEIKEIYDKNYQGTKIFIILIDMYQPGIEDYIITYIQYGSCSAYDTLYSIQCGNYDELPTDEQVKKYMTLALHLIQKMKPLYDLN